MEENKKLPSLQTIFLVINVILFVIILIFSTYTLRYTGQYELYINKDNKNTVSSYIGEEHLKKDSAVKKVIYREVWDDHEYIIYYENGEEETLFLDNIPWENNLIKEEGIYIPLKNFGIIFIFIILMILNTIKIRKIGKKEKSRLICGNISIMTILTIFLMVFCNFVFALSTPFLMIPVSVILVFGGAGVIGFISYFIERKKVVDKLLGNFFKILFVNYILLFAIYGIYLISWAGMNILAFDVIIFILLIAGETILGYIIGRGIHVPIHNRK